MIGTGMTVIDPQGELDLVGANDHTLDGRQLTNFGTVIWTGTGNILFSHGSRFDNPVGAVFDIQNDAGLLTTDGIPATFTNAGLLTKSGAIGTTLIDSGITFSNSGVLQVQIGTLFMNISSCRDASIQWGEHRDQLCHDHPGWRGFGHHRRNE
jgi:hypothetical protein